MIKRYKKNEIEKLVKILKNDGVISVPIDNVLDLTSETWVRDRVYAKIIEKMKKDDVI